MMEKRITMVSEMRPSLSSKQLNYPRLVVPEKSQKLPVRKWLSIFKDQQKDEICRTPNNLRCTQLTHPLKTDLPRNKKLDQTSMYKKPTSFLVNSPKPQERPKKTLEKRVQFSDHHKPFKILTSPVLSPTKEIKLPNHSSPETTKTATRAPVKETNSISPKTPKQNVNPKKPIIYDISREQSPTDSIDNSFKMEDQLLIETPKNLNSPTFDIIDDSLENLISPYDENRKRIEQFKAQLRANLSPNDIRSELRTIHDIIRIP